MSEEKNPILNEVDEAIKLAENFNKEQKEKSSAVPTVLLDRLKTIKKLLEK